jgi:hypothetical protein
VPSAAPPRSDDEQPMANSANSGSRARRDMRPIVRSAHDPRTRRVCAAPPGRAQRVRRRRGARALRTRRSFATRG